MKHAYLIIAHNNFPILEKQLRFLDSDDADFFIHIDAKVQLFDFDYFQSIPQKSKLTFVPRVSIHWGDVSMIKAEYSLIESALPGKYDYYHLLSGVDIPVKSREYIEHFFENKNGTNFVNFYSPEIPEHYLERVKYYYPWQNRDFKNRYFRSAVRAATAFFQRMWGVDRTRKHPELVFQKGTQWFSITHEFAQFIVENKPLALEIFDQSCCSDEMLVQTLLVNSPFNGTISPDNFQNNHACCLRYIDWNRGKPYTFTDADFDELKSTPENVLFARKFDYQSFPCIVDKLFSFFE